MTEEKPCYENAVAERVNGSLKDGFLPEEESASAAVANKAVRPAIKTSPPACLHLSLPLPQQAPRAA